MCTLTQMEQPTDMGCRTALFEVPWARSWKWLGPDLVPSLTTYQVLWCSGGTHCGGNQIMKPWWWLQYCDFGDYIYMIIALLLSLFWWWFMIMIHEYDEHNQCIVCILFFFRDWLSSVVPEFVFSATCWVALYGSPEIKGFTDLNEPFCCHLNRTPSDLARWT